MNTETSLELVNSAISDVEAELATLDELSAAAEASQSTIKELETTIFELHQNTGGIDQKVRASKLTTATSLLGLERSDLATFKAQIDAQTNRVVQFGQRATALLQQVWSALLEARKTGVETSLRATFDFRQIHTPATEFSSAAFCVIEVEAFRDTLFQHRWLPTERDLAILDARAMRERSEQLFTMATNEPGLELDIVNVQLTPIAKPKPTVVGNQLGTLSQAVAA